MKLNSFRVVPALPERLAGLREIAYNLRWSWDDDLRTVFSRLDRELWDRTYQNPVLLLGSVSQERLEALAHDDSYLALYDRALERLRSYINEPTAWDRRWPDRPLVAYFSAEYGLAECLPIYSGGLGVLSGHHLKSASDLGVPLVAVGLLYQQGYFRQYLSSDGWQQEYYPVNDFYNVPVQPATDAGRRARARRGRPRRPTPAWCRSGRPTWARAALPPRHQPAGEPAGPAGHHRPALRRRHGEPHPAGDRARHRRAARAARAGHRAGGLPHERGALGLPRPRADPRAHAGPRAAASARRLEAARAGERLHHPHAGARRASTSSARSSWTATSARTCRSSASRARRAPGARPAHRRRRHRRLQHGRAGPAHLRVRQRRERAARRGLAPAARRVLARACRSTRCRSGTSPTAPTPAAASRARWPGSSTATSGPGWTRRPGQAEVWAGVDAIPDEELWATHERRRERLVAFARRQARRASSSSGAPPRATSSGRAASSTRAPSPSASPAASRPTSAPT